MINNFKNCYSVAYIDILGTTEMTKRVDFSQIYRGNEIETIWHFLLDITKIDNEIQVYGISDSFIIVRKDFTKLIPILITLFQICWYVRDFRIRGSIEIGNIYPPSNDLIQKSKNNPNFVLPLYLYGDALTNAVISEKKLKGTRLIAGETLSNVINKNHFNEITQVLQKRENFFEIIWVDTNITQKVFQSLNNISRYHIVTKEDLKEHFMQYAKNPNDEYSKIMVGLGHEWKLI